VLALLTVLTGGLATLALSEMWVRNWMRTGVSKTVGVWEKVKLPAGKVLVYYESRVAVPTVDSDGLRADLKVFDAERERMKVTTLDGHLNYHLRLLDWSGIALWEVDVPAAGEYTLVCNNYNVLSDRDIPADDRIVFLRDPPSFHDVKKGRIFILVTGATITMTGVIVFYALHNLALQKRRRGAGQPSSV